MSDAILELASRLDEISHRTQCPNWANDQTRYECPRGTCKCAEERQELIQKAIAALRTIPMMAEGAANWDALRNCARLRLMGCAGLHEDSDDYLTNRAHIGLELWTIHEATGDPQHKQGLEYLDKFMKKARTVKGT